MVTSLSLTRTDIVGSQLASLFPPLLLQSILHTAANIIFLQYKLILPILWLIDLSAFPLLLVLVNIATVMFYNKLPHCLVT